MNSVTYIQEERQTEREMGRQHPRVDRTGWATPCECQTTERDGESWLPGLQWCPNGHLDYGIGAGEDIYAHTCITT
jgi:hypothetical protein